MDSACCGGPVGKIPTAPGTDEIARFAVLRPLTNWGKISGSYFLCHSILHLKTKVGGTYALNLSLPHYFEHATKYRSELKYLKEKSQLFHFTEFILDWNCRKTLRWIFLVTLSSVENGFWVLVAVHEMAKSLVIKSYVNNTQAQKKYWSPQTLV